MELAAQLRDVTPRKLEMSQPGRLAVPVACSPAGWEDTLMTVVAMSHGELSRYDTLLRFERGELRVEDAAALLGVCRRQVFRLLDRLRADGSEALVSWKRGRPSNRDFVDAFRTRVLDLVREHYRDFGQTPRRSKWQRCAGSTGSTIAACSAPSGISRPPRRRPITMQPPTTSIGPHDSNRTASGKSGTLHKRWNSP